MVPMFPANFNSCPTSPQSVQNEVVLEEHGYESCDTEKTVELPEDTDDEQGEEVAEDVVMDADDCAVTDGCLWGPELLHRAATVLADTVGCSFEEALRRLQFLPSQTLLNQIIAKLSPQAQAHVSPNALRRTDTGFPACFDGENTGVPSPRSAELRAKNVLLFCSLAKGSGNEA